MTATISVNFAWLIDLIPENIGKLSTFLCLITLLYAIKHLKQTTVLKDQEIEINKLEIIERGIRINHLKEPEHTTEVEKCDL